MLQQELMTNITSAAHVVFALVPEQWKRLEQALPDLKEDEPWLKQCAALALTVRDNKALSAWLDAMGALLGMDKSSETPAMPRPYAARLHLLMGALGIKAEEYPEVSPVPMAKAFIKHSSRQLPTKPSASIMQSVSQLAQDTIHSVAAWAQFVSSDSDGDTSGADESGGEDVVAVAAGSKPALLAKLSRMPGKSKASADPVLQSPTCKKCDAQLLPSDAFCRACSAPQHPVNPHGSCPSCMVALKKNQKWCGSCGSNVQAVQAKQCSKCLEIQQDVSHTFCMHCGQRFGHKKKHSKSQSATFASNPVPMTEIQDDENEAAMDRPSFFYDESRAQLFNRKNPVLHNKFPKTWQPNSALQSWRIPSSIPEAERIILTKIQQGLGFLYQANSLRTSADWPLKGMAAPTNWTDLNDINKAICVFEHELSYVAITKSFHMSSEEALKALGMGNVPFNEDFQRRLEQIAVHSKRQHLLFKDDFIKGVPNPTRRDQPRVAQETEKAAMEAGKRRIQEFQSLMPKAMEGAQPGDKEESTEEHEEEEHSRRRSTTVGKALAGVPDAGAAGGVVAEAAEGRGNTSPPCPAPGRPQEHARAPQGTGDLSAP